MSDLEKLTLNLMRARKAMNNHRHRGNAFMARIWASSEADWLKRRERLLATKRTDHYVTFTGGHAA